MLRLVAGLMCAALLGACQTAPASREPFFTLVDLTDDYAAFYDRTQGMDQAERVAQFKTNFNALFPGFYDPARTASFRTPEQYDAAVEASFENFPATRDRFLAVSSRFNAALGPAQISFARAFPDVRPIGQIYLLHALGEMDGGTRTINGVDHLIFGADVIVRVHNFENEQPFFHHELFHVYHSQFFESCDQVWCGVWREGLAVYVAKSLNPDANDDQLLLTRPQPLRPFYDAHATQSVCALRAALDTTANSDWLSGGRSAEGMTPRIGYYIGFLVAQEAGRTRSLRELAHLSVAQARPVVDAAFAALATCPQ